MDRMEERKAIAAELDAHKEAWNTVNDQPEVQAARAACSAARLAYEQADWHFSVVFNKYAPRDDEKTERLRKKHHGLMLTESEYPSVCRCAVSGLPIFDGDAVFVTGEEHEQTYILADVIQLSPAFSHLTPTIAKADPDEISEEDETEEDEAA